MRAKLIVANWKMNGSFGLIKEIFGCIRPSFSGNSLEIVICPPNVLLHSMNSIFEGSGISVGAQNVNPENKGAFTGETSAPLLIECGIGWCIVGHSERREYFGETDSFISRKMETLINHNIKPILCVGETLDERESFRNEEVVVGQIRGSLSRLKKNELSNCVLAYEPVWAIGTGKTSAPEQANEMHRIIRKELASLSSKEDADKMQILYGGSVNEENIRDLLAQEDIDGALIGGASLKVEKFQQILLMAK